MFLTRPAQRSADGADEQQDGDPMAPGGVRTAEGSEGRGLGGGPLRAAARAVTRWRRTRPFWAGVFTLLAGLVVLFPPFAALKLGDVIVSLNTLGGISATVIGAVLSVCGITFWVRPQFRMAAGIVALLLALTALVTTNLGSFLIGTLLGIVGAALGIAWSPSKGPSRRGSGAPGEVA